MKRRKGVTVFSVFALAFTILAIASYGVILYVLLPMVQETAGEGVKPLIDAFDIVARNKDIIAAFSNFDAMDVAPHYLTYAYIGIFVLVTTIWLIVDLKRSRKICFFFICIFLCACYIDLIYNLTIFPLQEFITANIEAQPLLFVPLGGGVLGALASLFAVILFIVDMATGKVNKEEAPTFIKEPTEEVEEGVFEEVKDESEVEEEKKEEKVAPAPAPVEEEKVEEAPVEEKPAEEKKEEKVAPAKKPAAKKAPAKKEEKKEPAKKAPAKKAEEKKPAPKKSEPAPKKDDARKTQTILLTNEEGNTYAKAYHVSRRAELNKWQVKATGSDKALKLFNTQKEAIEYANQLSKNQNVSIRVHSKEGKIRKAGGGK